jgi:hypothetical protein
MRCVTHVCALIQLRSIRVHEQSKVSRWAAVHGPGVGACTCTFFVTIGVVLSCTQLGCTTSHGCGRRGVVTCPNMHAVNCCVVQGARAKQFPFIPVLCIGNGGTTHMPGKLHHGACLHCGSARLGVVMDLAAGWRCTHARHGIVHALAWLEAARHCVLVAPMWGRGSAPLRG